MIGAFLTYLWSELNAFVPAILTEQCQAWQGGQLPVPWNLLKIDGETQQFHLVERQRLPGNIIALRIPESWDEQETWTWSFALRAKDVPAPQKFQFRQPRPGMVELDTRMEMHADSQLMYGPESILYAKRRLAENASPLSGVPKSWQGSPRVHGERCSSFTEDQTNEMVTPVTGCDSLVKLIKLADSYETGRPAPVRLQSVGGRASQLTIPYRPLTLIGRDLAHRVPIFGPHHPVLLMA